MVPSDMLSKRHMPVEGLWHQRMFGVSLKKQVANVLKTFCLLIQPHCLNKLITSLHKQSMKSAEDYR